MKFYVILTFFLLTNFSATAQTFDYMGLLALPNGTFITYKVELTNKNGLLKGHSFTDLNGKHETKSVLVGRFDDKKNKIEFREVDIVYTKSDVSQFDFCNVYFTGNVKKLDGKSQIQGDFKGFYNDLTKCIDGKLTLVSEEKARGKSEKFKSKLDKMKRIPDSIKQQIEVSKIFDQYKKKSLVNGEEVNFLTPESQLTLNLWDPGMIDGDEVDIILNNKVILKNYKISKNKKSVAINLTQDKNTLQIRAVDLGTKPPNTANIQIIRSGGETIDMATSLGLNEEVRLVFYRKKPIVRKK